MRAAPVLIFPYTVLRRKTVSSPACPMMRRMPYVDPAMCGMSLFYHIREMHSTHNIWITMFALLFLEYSFETVKIHIYGLIFFTPGIIIIMYFCANTPGEQMKPERIAAVVLLLCTVAALLSSCGFIVINRPGGESADSQTSEIEQTTAPETEPPYHGVTEDFSAQAKEYLDGVAGIDCGGAVIKIVSTSPELTGEDSAPEIISRAVEERNSAVEEKYNISLVTASADSATMYAELSASLKSGMYYADMLTFPQSTIPSLAAAGMLYNLRSMPGMKLDAPYFNQSAVEAASAGYRILAVAGEATYSPYSFPAVFFSVDKLNAAGLELPYKSAKAGTWTWDEFYSYCTAALGAGYGTVCTGDTGDFALDCAFFSAGGKLISAGAMKYPTVALTEDNSNAIIEMLSRIFKADGALTGESGGHGAFSSCVFMIDTMGSLYTMADSAERWGIVPMPKASADQESYISAASPSSLFFGVPATVSADERTSLILQAMFAASYGNIPSAFVDYTQNSMLRDNESANMLSIIMKNELRYDFAYTAGTMYSDTPNATYYAVRNAILGESTIGEMIRLYASSCERALRTAFPMTDG